MRCCSVVIGNILAAIGEVAISEWMDLPLLVSARSRHQPQHRSRETVPLLVSCVRFEALVFRFQRGIHSTEFCSDIPELVARFVFISSKLLSFPENRNISANIHSFSGIM